MKDIFLWVGIILIFMIIGVTWDKLTSYAILKRFNRYDFCNGWIDGFVGEIKQKLGIKDNVLVAINKKAKNVNADVGVYKNNILIVLHGKWSENNIKFVIGHELAHIKLKHREVTNNMFFITCMFMISMVIIELLLYIFAYGKITKYIGVIESITQLITFIIFGIWILVHRRNYNKENWNREYQADLLAANLVGLDLAVDAIGLLKDSKNTNYKYSHPSNHDRIQYLMKNFNIKGKNYVC